MGASAAVSVVQAVAVAIRKAHSATDRRNEPPESALAPSGFTTGAITNLGHVLFPICARGVWLL